MEERITKEQQGTFWGDEYVNYLDCDDGFPGIYMSKFIKLHTLNMFSLLYVNYT